MQPKSETSILTMKGGSPHGPQSPPVFLAPGSYQAASPQGGNSQSQLYIEVSSHTWHSLAARLEIDGLW